MERVNIDIRFEGNKLSPEKLKTLTGFPIEVLAEYGEVAKIGRYKGMPSPYGLALLKVSKKQNKNINDILNTYLNKLIVKKEKLARIGVEEIIIDVETPPIKESELSFDKNILSKLLKLNARIDVHAINEEDEPDFAFNKAELIESIASKAKLTKAEAIRSLAAFVSATSKSLKGGNRVALVGFGSFSVAKRKARTGRNPQTGKSIRIPAKKVVKFKADADLVEAVA